MRVGRLGHVMVVFVGIFEIRLEYIPAWKYQRTFQHSYNPNLIRDNFDLPNQLRI